MLSRPDLLHVYYLPDYIQPPGDFWEWSRQVLGYEAAMVIDPVNLRVKCAFRAADDIRKFMMHYGWCLDDPPNQP